MNAYIQHSDAGQVATNGVHKFTANATAFADAMQLLALSIVGTGTAVDAIRASISTGRHVTISYKDNSKPPFSKMESRVLSGADAKYRVFRTRITQISMSHYVFLNECLFARIPEESSSSYYMMQAFDNPYPVCSILKKLLPRPILPSWYEQIERHNKLGSDIEQIKPITNQQGFNIYRVSQTLTKWSAYITSNVASGTLQFPEGTENG